MQDLTGDSMSDAGANSGSGEGRPLPSVNAPFGVTPLPGGLLFAHGVTCARCGYAHCALWGFAPLGKLPPNAICPECGHKWVLPPSFHDALVEAAAIPRMAVLLDADNIESHLLAELRDFFEKRGQLLIFRAYGNRHTFAGPVWNEAIAAGLDLVICEVRPQAADMTMAVDLGVLGATRSYQEIFVVSADRALSIAAEHVAARFGERQLVYCGQPQAILHHLDQCRLGVKHARVDEIVGLLQLVLFENGGRMRSDELHRALLDMVPWFHVRLFGVDAFPAFVSEHFPVNRDATHLYWVSLPKGAEATPAVMHDEDVRVLASRGRNAVEIRQRRRRGQG